MAKHAKHAVKPQAAQLRLGQLVAGLHAQPSTPTHRQKKFHSASWAPQHVPGYMQEAKSLLQGSNTYESVSRCCCTGLPAGPSLPCAQGRRPEILTLCYDFGFLYSFDNLFTCRSA
jgi:hypothetical protein